MSFNDDEIKRLLRQYYQPATASPDFKEKLHKLVLESNGEAADVHPSRPWLKPFILTTIGIAAAALIATGVIFFPRGQNSEIASIITTTTTTTTIAPTSSTTSPTAMTTTPASTATTSSPTSTIPTSTQPTATTPVAIAKGTLVIRVTDAPPQHNVTAINVILSDIRVNQSEDENTDGGWVVVYDGEPLEFDLLKLKEQGDAEIIGQADIDVGHYSQIRMNVEFVSADIDGQPVDIVVDVPSNVLRLVASFDMRENQVTELTIDFDAEQSLVFTGQGKINFKPVVTLIVEYPD